MQPTAIALTGKDASFPPPRNLWETMSFKLFNLTRLIGLRLQIYVSLIYLPWKGVGGVFSLAYIRGLSHPMQRFISISRFPSLSLFLAAFTSDLKTFSLSRTSSRSGATLVNACLHETRHCSTYAPTRILQRSTRVRTW